MMATTPAWTRAGVMVITLVVSLCAVDPGEAQLTSSNACEEQIEGTPFSEHDCQCVPVGSFLALRCVVSNGATPLNQFPTTGKVFETVTRLEFEEYTFTKITTANMQQFPNLEDVQIKMGKLRTIEPDAFTGLLGLKTLNLSSNELTEFPYVSNLPRLTRLDVSDNVITSVDYEQVKGLSYLNELHMEENRFRILESNTLRDSCRLNFLNASKNEELEVIQEYFFNNTRLTTLDLSHTKITELPTNGLVRLENLYLEGNEDLKRFPSLYSEEYNADLCTYKTFPFLRLVKATYHAHCCAFKGHTPLYQHPLTGDAVQRCIEAQFNQPRSIVGSKSERHAVVRRSVANFTCINTATGDVVHDPDPSPSQIFTKSEVCPFLNVCFPNYCPESCDVLSFGSGTSSENMLPTVVCVETENFDNSSVSVLHYIITFLNCTASPTVPSISASPTPFPPTDSITDPPTELCDSFCEYCLTMDCMIPECPQAFPVTCGAKRRRSTGNEEEDLVENLFRHRRQENSTESQLVSCSEVTATISPSDIIDYLSATILYSVVASTVCKSTTPTPSLSSYVTSTPSPLATPTPTPPPDPPAEPCDSFCEYCLTMDCMIPECPQAFPVRCGARKRRSPGSTKMNLDQETLFRHKRQEHGTVSFVPTVIPTPALSSGNPSSQEQATTFEYMSCSVLLATVSPSHTIPLTMITSSHLFSSSTQHVVEMTDTMTATPTPTTDTVGTDIAVCVLPVLQGTLYIEDVNDTECFPEEDPFNPCNDVLDYELLRAAIWIVIIVAIGGNSVVIGITIAHLVRSRRTGTNTHIMYYLYINLAVADLFMGIYLLTIASVDVDTRGEYSLHAVEWQTGPGCDIAGFFAILSSIMSIYTLVVITLERTYTIKFALQRKELAKRYTMVIMAAGWITAFIIALLPIVGVSSYGSVSICLPFDVEDDAGLSYVSFLMVITGIASLAILVCYVYLFYLVACGAKKKKLYGSMNGREELKLALRMSLLIITDFACWGPIAFFGLTAALWMPLISLEDSKIIMVFVFPLNSCLNPILYSFSTRTFRHNFCLVLSYCGLCKNYGKQVYSSASYPTKDPVPPANLLHRRMTEISILSWFSSAMSARRGSSVSNSTRSLDDISSSRQTHRASICSTQSGGSSELNADIYPADCSIPLRRLREPRQSVCSLSVQLNHMQALPEEAEEGNELSPTRGNSDRSSDSDSSKEYVDFKYNPVYKDTDPEDVDHISSQTNAGLSTFSRGLEGNQETTFIDEAEILRNEGFELLPEVGGFTFSPKHVWARALSPDLHIEKGTEHSEEWVGSTDTVVSSQDPDFEVHCNKVVFD